MDAPHEEGGAGFLFAFYKYSKLDAEHVGVVQRLVHALTASDAIHVAVVPVHRCYAPAHAPACVHPAALGMDCGAMRIEVGPTAYTAFIGWGFAEQPSEDILTPEYDFIYLHVGCPETVNAGIRFLMGLRGANYNYYMLPWTLLPRAWKGGHEKARRRNIDGAHTAPTHKRAIFCSEMGLLLYYMCRGYSHPSLPPSECTPGELAQILLEEGGATPCDPRCISVVTRCA